jgi:hypothetical protein
MSTDPYQERHEHEMDLINRKGLVAYAGPAPTASQTDLGVVRDLAVELRDMTGLAPIVCAGIAEEVLRWVVVEMRSGTPLSDALLKSLGDLTWDDDHGHNTMRRLIGPYEEKP